MDLEPIIGLEIHLQLKTKSKMFCVCENQDPGQGHPSTGSGQGEKEPNTNVCPVCLGHPGTLPVINRVAVEQGMKLALALNAYVNRKSKFDRKNYFYPDLPKGYQITQFDEPLATDGHIILQVEGREHRFGIERLHLEEDAGKNIHQGEKTLVNFNRAGVPLVEMVTKPDFRSPAEAKKFLQEIRLIARYLGVSEADMEKGQMRCDANISLRPVGDIKFYPKTEVKNMNSFRSVERALAFEIDRQTELWREGKQPTESTTRGWNDEEEVTLLQRSKEESNDYRYFPEPDLPLVEISSNEVEEVKNALPELPHAKRTRFQTEYFLSYADAEVLSADKEVAAYFENTVSELKNWLESSGEVDGSVEEMWQKSGKKLARLSFSWITTELFKHLNSGNFDFSEVKITSEDLAEFIIMVYQGKINSSAAQLIFNEMMQTGEDPHAIAERLDLHQDNDEGSLESLVQQIISEQPEMVAQYKAGKETLLQFFIGLGMKASKGKANPKILEQLFKKNI
jgi:aspartyl-tRNA(Asn)/glutamyl-tRNA(Gln) amidotransferase subunit B